MNLRSMVKLEPCVYKQRTPLTNIMSGVSLMEHSNTIPLIGNFKPIEHIESEYVTEATQYRTNLDFEDDITSFVQALADGEYQGNGVLVWVCQYAHARTGKETPKSRAVVQEKQVRMIKSVLGGKNYKNSGLNAQYVAGLSETTNGLFCKHEADAPDYTFVPMWGVVFTRKQDNNKSTVTPAMVLQKRKPTIWIRRLKHPFPTSDEYVIRHVYLRDIANFWTVMTALMKNLKNGDTDGKGILVWIYDSALKFSRYGAVLTHASLKEEINHILNKKPFFGSKPFEGITAQCIDQREMGNRCTILTNPLIDRKHASIALCAVLLTYAKEKPHLAQAQNVVKTRTICMTCHREVLY